MWHRSQNSFKTMNTNVHEQHLRTCKRSLTVCRHCSFIRNWKKLRAGFPWLQDVTAEKYLRVTCTICLEHGTEPFFSSCPAIKTLKRHEQSHKHQRATKTQLGIEMENPRACPTADDFKTMWRERRQASSLIAAGQSNDGVSHFRSAKKSSGAWQRH